MLSYVHVKIAELGGHKQELLARIAELTVEAISPEQVSQISGYLDTWENVSFDDKRRVVDLMITTIAATSDSWNITCLLYTSLSDIRDGRSFRCRLMVVHR